MLTLLNVIGKAKQQEKIIMSRIHRIIEFALLTASIIFVAWLSLRRDPAPMLSNLRTIICTPSRRLPGGELPEPPRGWHYRPDDRLETDAQ